MQLLTVAESARRLAVHPDTIRNLIDREQLIAVRIGRAVRIEERELEQLVTRQRPRRQPPAPAAVKASGGQGRALHAKANVIDTARGSKSGTAKAEALATCSQQFGRQITSSRELSEDEASFVLEWMSEVIESL